MNEGLAKFQNLLFTDEDFQQKLKTAAEAYNGEQTEEAVFENILVPLAAEYDISATYEEFKEYIAGLNAMSMDESELKQISGGGKGGGATACFIFGVGFGGGSENYWDAKPDEKKYGGCFGIGAGSGAGACWGEGNWS